MEVLFAPHRFLINNVWAMGNSNLEPETIKTLELAFDYQLTDNLNFAANIFNYQLRDGIIFTPDSEGNVFRANNAGSQDGNGLELETRWKMTKRARLLVNYAFVKAINKITDQDAGNYPRNSGYLRTDWLLYPNWYFNGQINWVGKIERVANDPRNALNQYTTVDLTLRRKNSKEENWNLAMSVRNLFDADARAPSEGPANTGVMDLPNDLPLAERNYWLEVGYRF